MVKCQTTQHKTNQKTQSDQLLLGKFCSLPVVSFVYVYNKEYYSLMILYNNKITINNNYNHWSNLSVASWSPFTPSFGRCSPLQSLKACCVKSGLNKQAPEWNEVVIHTCHGAWTRNGESFSHQLFFSIQVAKFIAWNILNRKLERSGQHSTLLLSLFTILKNLCL